MGSKKVWLMLDGCAVSGSSSGGDVGCCMNRRKLKGWEQVAGSAMCVEDRLLKRKRWKSGGCARGRAKRNAYYMKNAKERC